MAAISRSQQIKELIPGLNALFGNEYSRYGGLSRSREPSLRVWSCLHFYGLDYSNTKYESIGKPNLVAVLALVSHLLASM